MIGGESLDTGSFQWGTWVIIKHICRNAEQLVGQLLQLGSKACLKAVCHSLVLIHHTVRGQWNF